MLHRSVEERQISYQCYFKIILKIYNAQIYEYKYNQIFKFSNITLNEQSQQNRAFRSQLILPPTCYLESLLLLRR